MMVEVALDEKDNKQSQPDNPLRQKDLHPFIEQNINFSFTSVVKKKGFVHEQFGCHWLCLVEPKPGMLLSSMEVDESEF